VSAWLTIGSLLLRLVLLLSEMARERQQQGVGYAKAMAETLEKAHREIAIADAEEQQTDAKHRDDPTDNAFDREFERRE
jgi:hypothetical protein